MFDHNNLTSVIWSMRGLLQFVGQNKPDFLSIFCYNSVDEQYDINYYWHVRKVTFGGLCSVMVAFEEISYPQLASSP